MLENPFVELAGLLLVSAAIGWLGLRLRQPLVVAFVAAGVLAGPAGLDWVRSREQLHLLAQVGIALLLFVVGLRLDLRLVRSIGPVALATGLVQVAATAAAGLALCLALGMGGVPSIYVAVALAFSSTIIVVKLLTDKREIDSLHGRIAIGLLIVQDLLVVLAMVALVAWSASQQAGSPVTSVLGILARGAGLLGGFLLVGRLVLPRLLPALGRSPEVLVLFAVAWAVIAAAASEILGFGKELGALGAGVALASTPQREILVARLASLRDFLLLFFFVDLGARLDLASLAGQLAPALALSLLVLVGKPLVVLWTMGWLGYRSRTGFLAGLAVAQISEFSLILGALGVSLGHLDPGALGLITVVGLATIAASTYLILYSHPLYDRLAPWLEVFERSVAFAEEERLPPAEAAEILLVGLGRHGGHLAAVLRQRGHAVLGVDFDPETVATWRESGLPARLGDATDPEFAATLPLAEAAWVVCTLPDLHSNLALLQALREHGFSGRIALGARTAEDARRLAERGADAVLYPFEDAAREAADLLCGPRRPAEA